MLNDIKIKNTDELEFAVFCIENIAMSLKKWYRALTEKSDILNSYVIPEYEMLHTLQIPAHLTTHSAKN